MAPQQCPQSLVVASRTTLARASQNLQSGTSDPCRLLLEQPGISLHYSGGHLQRSMPPRERGSPIWPPLFRIAGLRMLQYRTCIRRARCRIQWMEKAQMYNVVIIGSGCAGLTAAIYAARANLKPLVLDGPEPGGQLSPTTHVENFPGFPDGIMGPELIENMRKQAQNFATVFNAGAVSELDVSLRPFKITSGQDTYETKSLILA